MKRYYKWTLPFDYSFYTPFDMPLDREYKDKNGKVWLTVENGKCTIHKGYSWDGCSPKYKIGKVVVGAYDGSDSYVHNIYHNTNRGEVKLEDTVDIDQQLKYASLEHDALYQFLEYLPINVSKEKVDKMFYEACKATGFKLSWLYYQAVKRLSGIWNKIK